MKTDTPDSQSQLQRYAEDIAKLHASEKDKRIRLEQITKQLQQYAHDLNIVYKEKINEEKLRLKLARYLSPSIIDDIVSNKKEVTLGGELRHVSILFADIRGFTSLAERLNVKEVFGLLNDFFEMMTKIVFKYEGTLDKFIGDAIMVIFGAPFSLIDHEFFAVQAALEMQESIRTHNLNKKQLNQFQFEIGIGINCGKVITGDIGSEKRMDYTAIGDVVNVAFHIQSIAKGGQILIGQEIYPAVKDRFICGGQTNIKLKHRKKTETVYEVSAKTQKP